MRLMVAIVVVVLLVVTGAADQYYYSGGAGVPPAQAQDGKAPEPKGVTSRGLVGSTGPIASVGLVVPAALSGQIVELAPGGQTGRQRNLAPSFLYVLQGTLVIDTMGGPISVSGVQYHGEGQAYAGPANLWYNVMNTGQKPAKYLLLFVAPPGAKTLETFKADE
ncbi:MAG TPA: cupin domain-containing protein [Methylomirabilota bacterium]|jgi:quercetin dioxygenase-like cupin family protein